MERKNDRKKPADKKPNIKARQSHRETPERESTQSNSIMALAVIVLLMLLSGMLTSALSDWFKNSQLEKQTADVQTDGLLMSPDELRSFQGFEGLSDQEARGLIHSMQQFCNITLDMFNHENNLGSI